MGILCIIQLWAGECKKWLCATFAATCGFRLWSTRSSAPRKSAGQRCGIRAASMAGRGKRRLKVDVAGEFQNQKCSDSNRNSGFRCLQRRNLRRKTLTHLCRFDATITSEQRVDVYDRRIAASQFSVGWCGSVCAGRVRTNRLVRLAGRV